MPSLSLESDPAPLPPPDAQGHVPHDGARIWYATFGTGAPVLLLHGGMGNADDWGNQVPALVAAGYRAVVVDSRGHGRSTRDARAFSYVLMASDVVAVMDALAIARAAVVGWSDGAIVALTLAMDHADRVSRVVAFGVNTDLGGLKEVSPSDPPIAQAMLRNAKGYARLSETPEGYKAFCGAVIQMMATQPDYGAAELARIRVPVAVVAGEHDEFITRAHTEKVAAGIAGATLRVLGGVSHFAPLQDPALFNATMVAFLGAP